MADIAPGGRLPAASARTSGRHRAASIYGAIITAAILDTAGGRLPTDVLVVGVVAALVVYWLAEQYAELLGEQIAGVAAYQVHMSLGVTGQQLPLQEGTEQRVVGDS